MILCYIQVLVKKKRIVLVALHWDLQRREGENCGFKKCLQSWAVKRNTEIINQQESRAINQKKSKNNLCLLFTWQQTAKHNRAMFPVWTIDPVLPASLSGRQHGVNQRPGEELFLFWEVKPVLNDSRVSDLGFNVWFNVEPGWWIYPGW